MASDDLRLLVDWLRAAGLIGESFSGRLVINLNQGGVTEVERSEFLSPAQRIAGGANRTEGLVHHDCRFTSPQSPCPSPAGCLCGGEPERVCPTERVVGESLIFVAVEANRFCPLKMQFGNGSVCICPHAPAVQGVREG